MNDFGNKLFLRIGEVGKVPHAPSMVKRDVGYAALPLILEPMPINLNVNGLFF